MLRQQSFHFLALPFNGLGLLLLHSSGFCEYLLLGFLRCCGGAYSFLRFFQHASGDSPQLPLLLQVLLQFGDLSDRNRRSWVSDTLHMCMLQDHTSEMLSAWAPRRRKEKQYMQNLNYGQCCLVFTCSQIRHLLPTDESEIKKKRRPEKKMKHLCRLPLTWWR